MSLKAINKVWGHSKASGGGLLALLAIADYAHDNGTNAFPSVETLQHKTRYRSKQGLIKTVNKLIQSGELVKHLQRGPGGVNLYDIIYQDNSNIDVINTRCEKYKTEYGGEQTFTHDKNEGVNVCSPQQSTTVYPNNQPQFTPPMGKPQLTHIHETSFKTSFKQSEGIETKEKQTVPSPPPKPSFPSSFDSQVSHTSKTILHQPIMFKDKDGKIINAMVVSQTPKQLKVATMNHEKFTLRSGRDNHIAYLNGKVSQVVWAGSEPEKESDPVVQILNDLVRVIDEAIIATSTEADFAKYKNYAIRALKGNVLKPGQILEFKHWYYDINDQWQSEKNPITIYTILGSKGLVGKYNNWLKSGKKPYAKNKKEAQPSRHLITRDQNDKQPQQTVVIDNEKRNAEIAELVAAGVAFTKDSEF